MKEAGIYKKEFFESHLDGPYRSAQQVVPIIYDLFKPESVVDFGCGIGNWLKVWMDETPVKEVFGIEGPYITEDLFKVPAHLISLKDLKQPIRLPKRYDLAVSLEVAEHIHAHDAGVFLENLVAASDVIVFSAAIKGQLGTYHVNEQYPEYWAEKFHALGYEAVDCFRHRIWNNHHIEYWYRQNMLLFIKKERLQDFPAIMDEYHRTDPRALLRVHPEQYELKLQLIDKISSFSGFLRWKLYPLKLALKKLFNIQ